MPCGKPRWMGQRAVMGRGPQRRRRVLCGAEPSGCGGALREADTPHGWQPVGGGEVPRFDRLGSENRLG
jgi:hypothetical protein